MILHTTPQIKYITIIIVRRGIKNLDNCQHKNKQ